MNLLAVTIVAFALAFIVSTIFMIVQSRFEGINVSNKTIRMFSVSAAAAAAVGFAVGEWHLHDPHHFVVELRGCVDDPGCFRELETELEDLSNRLAEKRERDAQGTNAPSPTPTGEKGKP